MNLIWNKNLELFKLRFPQLQAVLPEKTSDKIEITTAKDGNPNAMENSLPFHSKYAPLKEAAGLTAGFNPKAMEAAVFMSFGLGYGPIAFAKAFPSKTLILIEPDPSYFFTALSVLDWEDVFKHQKLFLLIGASEKECASVLGKYQNQEMLILKNANQENHSKEYFFNIDRELSALRQKDQVNTNTLEKFSKLWVKNSCRNLKTTALLKGVNTFFNKATDLPFLILAAGPSLASVIPHLKELSKRMITVCVDTALHAVLKAGIQPDFIILVDPQFYCALHLEFLESPNSILIAESAVYPSVFRFKCKDKILCSSLFPIGKYFEARLGQKGALGAGGSVTTTAWDFAKACGAKEIYMAGMDLGFPARQTHVKGSQFEQQAVRTQTRIHTAENTNAGSLMTANPILQQDYNGKKLITDKKMELFKTWYETNCTKALTEGTKTYTLTKESLFICGIESAELTNVLKKTEITEQKHQFLSLLTPVTQKEAEKAEENFSAVLNEFIENLDFLGSSAKKGIELCEKAIQNRIKAREIAIQLDAIDRQILSSKAKDSCSLVFPTQRQLEELSKDIPQNTELSSFYLSRTIYRQVLNACREFKKYL